VLRGARADPDDVVAQERVVDQDAIDVREWERGNGARLEAGRLLHLGGPRDSGLTGLGGARDLVEVGATVARDHGDDGAPVADEDE
jgi:hypothetical protein